MAILGTAHILMERANVKKVQNTLHRRNNITCSTIVHTGQLQHCMP